MTQGQVQLGKKGVTENFIETLREYSEEILEGLGKNYTVRIIGFTIFVKKWRKARR